MDRFTSVKIVMKSYAQRDRVPFNVVSVEVI